MATDIPDDLVARIAELHAGPERGYHGWSHPLALLALLREVEAELHDPPAVRGAILMHDAVYDPHAADNEARSAGLARAMLADALPPATLARTIRLIEATAGHAIPPGLPADEAADMGVFLDMDLSILAAAPAAFDAYEAGVRHEYRHVPDAVFAPARAAILREFLGRETLYLSAWGRRRFEEAARANLRRSIAALESRR